MRKICKCNCKQCVCNKAIMEVSNNDWRVACAEAYAEAVAIEEAYEVLQNA